MSSSDSVLKISMAAFDQASSLTNLFVVPVALARVAYLNASGSQSSDYSRLAKGVVLYFILIYSYEPILKILLDLPSELLPNFNFGASAATGITPSGVQEHVVAAIPNVLTWVMESIIVVLYYAATCLNFVISILMSSMAPVIFLLGGILGIGLGVGTFLSLLIMVSCWPIVFAACEAMRHVLSTELSLPIFGASVAEIILALFKLIGPIAMAKSAMHSPVAQAMKSVASTGSSGAAGGVTKIKAFRAGQSGKAFSHEPRNLGQMVSAKTGEFAHRAGASLRNLAQDKSSVSRAQTVSKSEASSGPRQSPRDLHPPLS